MLDKLKENPIEAFINAMSKLGRLGKIERKEWSEADKEVERFSLASLMGCFKGAKKDTFLSDKPLEAFTSGMLSAENVDIGHNQIDPINRADLEYEFSLENDVPEGTLVTLVICPTRSSGLQLPPKYYDDSTNDIYPYFKVLYSNSKSKSGEALGMDNTRAVPYLKLFPQEFIDETSFIVEYSNGKNRKEGESDYQYFTRMLTEKYERLRELAYGYL